MRIAECGSRNLNPHLNPQSQIRIPQYERSSRYSALVGFGTYEVSEDGQMMTAKVRGTDAKGLPFEQAIVFDRSTVQG